MKSKNRIVVVKKKLYNIILYIEIIISQLTIYGLMQRLIILLLLLLCEVIYYTAVHNMYKSAYKFVSKMDCTSFFFLYTNYK